MTNDFFKEIPIMDIHQHTNYCGRSNDDLIKHQEILGAKISVLLSAGSKYGLEADCGDDSSVKTLAKKYPDKFLFFVNETPEIQNADRRITESLDDGGIGIGEQKFFVRSDSSWIYKIAQIAQQKNVPVLLHFYKTYNSDLKSFTEILKTFPTVNFIGHAQGWWGNISADYDQVEKYPTSKIIRGGLTDIMLSDYPNLYADLSARSGLNAIVRDETFIIDFIERHQDKIVFGSDCPCLDASSGTCIGQQILSALKNLSLSEVVLKKILYANTASLLNINKDFK